MSISPSREGETISCWAIRSARFDFSHLVILFLERKYQARQQRCTKRLYICKRRRMYSNLSGNRQTQFPGQQRPSNEKSISKSILNFTTCFSLSWNKIIFSRVMNVPNKNRTSETIPKYGLNELKIRDLPTKRYKQSESKKINYFS